MIFQVLFINRYLQLSRVNSLNQRDNIVFLNEYKLVFEILRQLYYVSTPDISVHLIIDCNKSELIIMRNRFFLILLISNILFIRMYNLRV